MNNLEEIYDQALEMLKQGHSKEEVLVKFAQVKNELAPLISLSFPLLTMPKNIVPTPMMKRKYSSVPAKSLWLVFTKFSKFASVSVGLILLVTAFAATTYAANKSGPGQALFSVKKGLENAQLFFATNQDEKASLQVAIAQKRLTEAQAIFSDPNSDTGQKNAALTELADQTTSAVAQVNTVAKSDPKAAQNHPLLNSLASITQAQASLLAQIKPDAQIQVAANSAQASLTQNSAQLSKINETVAVADSDQALATLNADPNSVAVLGQITKLADNQVTVEKTTFTLTTLTIIQNSEGTILSVHDLAINQKVSVIGVKNSGSPVAKQIMITKDQNPVGGSVQGDSTQVPSTPATSTIPSASTKTPASLLPPLPTAISPSPSPSPASGAVVGSFIPEDPSQ